MPVALVLMVVGLLVRLGTGVRGGSVEMIHPVVTRTWRW